MAQCAFDERIVCGVRVNVISLNQMTNIVISSGVHARGTHTITFSHQPSSSSSVGRLFAMTVGGRVWNYCERRR